jgi:sugar lactone lactonase YvrE
MNPRRRNIARCPSAAIEEKTRVRGFAQGCGIAVLLAACPLFATAQNPSAKGQAAANGSRDGTGSAQAANAAGGIQSSKAVVIIAAGIAPRALTVDRRANVYLTNASAPNRLFTLTGLSGFDPSASEDFARTVRLAAVAGNGTAGSLGDGGNALGAEFDLELDSLVMRSGVAVSDDGTLVISDTLNSTIRRISGSDGAEPGVVRSIAGRWAAKQNVALGEPLGVAVDSAGNLYVADRGTGSIDLLPSATTSLPNDQQIEMLAHLVRPTDVALTVDGGTIFAASSDTGAIFAVNTQTREIRQIAAFPPRDSSASGQATPACAGSKSGHDAHPPVCPAGLAVDGGGNLFVADANAGNILRVDAKTSAVTTEASRLESPGEIQFDASGNLYVAEQGAGRIVKFVSMGQDPSNLTISPPPTLPAPPPPRVCPLDAPFNFCDQPTGGTTPAQPFTLTNNTAAAVTGLNISFTGANPGDFQTVGNTCGTSLSAGGSCTINVEFAPTATGSRAASLAVTDAAADSATSSVTGTGDDFQITLNGSPMEQSVIQGGKVTFNFNVTPDSVFGGTVTLQCPTNLPTLTVCTVNPTTVTVTPGKPVSFSVMFETTFDGVTGGYPTSGLLSGFSRWRDRNPPASPMWAFALLPTLLAASGFAMARPKRGARFGKAGAMPLFVIFLLASVIAMIDGCKGAAVPPGLNTPAGSTNMIVQGTAQNAGRGASITLDVVGRG